MSKEVERFDKKNEIAVDESMLRSETASNGLYQTPIDSSTYTELEKQAPKTSMTNFAPVLLPAGAMGVLISVLQLFYPPSDPGAVATWMLGWASAGTGAAGLTSGYMFKAYTKENRNKAFRLLIARHNADALRLWLKKRYSIFITDEVFAELAWYVRKENEKTGLLIRFYDVDNVLYELHNDKYNRRYVTKVDSTPQDYKTPVTPVKEDVEVATITQEYLSEDSNHLVERITTISQKLRDSALTTEQTHELDRIVDETKKVCEIRAGIFALDPEQEESGSVRKTLASLQNQIQALLRVQIAELEKELTVQNTYVTANDVHNNLAIEKVGASL